MIMQKVAPAADGSHELIGTSVVNRNTAHASISEIERVPLAHFCVVRRCVQRRRHRLGAPMCAQLDPERVAAVTGLSATASFSPRLLKPKR